ncbi:MAG: UDP-N-acetylmuramoyl-tripeptide--D-alanyl-D-alanine ligase [Chloroflexota bacterium]
MTTIRVRDAAKVVGGGIIGDADATFLGGAADSRIVRPGQLFVALPGERVDGHAFVESAFAAGATVALVSRPPATVPAGKAAIVVPDSLAALIALGKWQLTEHPLRIVAVTGSVGKTTTKDLIAAALSTHFKVLSNEGNLNSEVGLPLTLLRLEPEHELAVLEMGMRGKGQIAQLCGIAPPNVAVLTNILEVHLELLGTIENIAAAKAELLAALPPDGIAVLNADDPRVRAFAGRYGGMTILYGTSETADVMATDILSEPSGSTFSVVVSGERLAPARTEIPLPVPGKHNVLNAVAAVAVGLALGVPIERLRDGLENARPSAMRLETFALGNRTIINDAYNASPASMRAALNVLRDLAGGRKVAVLGNMLELGPLAREWHRDIGAAVAEIGCDVLITVGDLAAFIADGAMSAGLAADAVTTCSTNQEAIAALDRLMQEHDTILIKGSRGMQMEDIVAALKKR